MVRGATRLALALVIPAMVGSGCGKKDAPAPAQQADVQPLAPGGSGTAPTPTTPDQPTEDGRPRRELEPTADPPAPDKTQSTLASSSLSRIPKDAPFVVTLRLTEVLGALGYADLVKRHDMMLASFASPMVEMTGHNLFLLENWAKIGIDLSAPAGFFGIDYRTNGGVLFLGVSDRKLLETFILDTAKKAGTEMVLEKVGDQSLLTIAGENHGAIVVTDSAVYSINLFRGTGASDIARGIATREPNDSLLGSDAFKQLGGRVDSADGGLYLDFGDYLARRLDSEDYLKGPSASIATELEEAKKAGDTDRVESLTRDLEFYREQDAYYAKRNRAERDLTKRVISGMSTLVAGLDIGADGIDIDVRIPLADGAMLKALLLPNDGIVPVLKLSGGAPLLSVGGKVDVKTAIELLGLMMAAEGADMAELRTALKNELGVDLDADLFSHLNGHIGFAILGDVGTVFRSKDPVSALGGAFILGLTSPDGLKASLTKFAALPGVSELGSWDEATSTFTGKMPNDQAFTVAISGTWLVVSTETDSRSRLDGKDSFVDGLGNAALKKRLGKQGLSMAFQMQQAFAMGWLFVGSGMRSGASDIAPPDEPETMKTIREELIKLEAEIEPLRTKVEEARMKPLLDALSKLGHYAQTARVADGVLEASTGIYTSNATLAEAVGSLVDYAIAAQSGESTTPDEDKLRELENKRWELESQLWRAVPAPAPDFDD